MCISDDSTQLLIQSPQTHCPAYNPKTPRFHALATLHLADGCVSVCRRSAYDWSRKHLLCLYRVKEDEWNFGRTLNALGTQADMHLF